DLERGTLSFGAAQPAPRATSDVGHQEAKTDASVSGCGMSLLTSIPAVIGSEGVCRGPVTAGGTARQPPSVSPKAQCQGIWRAFVALVHRQWWLPKFVRL